MRITVPFLLTSVLACAWLPSSGAEPTDWFKESKYGVFMHFLPGDPAQLRQVKAFDVDALARQLESVGAGHFVLTLGQNSGYFNAPNAAYSRITGYAPGERCSVRDLPIELSHAFAGRGIKLMLYLPCQTPNQDPVAQKAFEIRPDKGDQRIDPAFAAKWAEVIREWSDRYGDRIAGWWFDGGYEWVGFNEEIAKVYAAAARHGNPRAIVTFNPGVKLIRWTRAEDYTAGELDQPFGALPTSRWVDGSQWHALTFLGSGWGGRDVRFPDEKWVEWVREAVRRGGVVTLDAGPNWDPAAGPIGTLSGPQLRQLRAIRQALEK